MIEQAIECGDLRLAFEWCGDRYHHAILRRVLGSWEPAVASWEGASGDHWPPSPPLQNLHIEDRSAGRVALLVGQAGTSHWSASVEPHESGAGFRFDVAARVRQSPPRLGSVYRSSGSVQRLVQFAALPPDATVEFQVEPDKTVWQVHPTAVTSDYPSTIRWRYVILAVIGDV